MPARRVANHLRVHFRDQLGAESIAPVAAQAIEAQRRGGKDRTWRIAVARQPVGGQIDVELPAPDRGGCRSGFAGLLRSCEQALHHLLHGVIVVIAHLRLAILERPRTGCTRGEEQVRIRMPRGLQPGLHRGIAHRGGVAPAQRDGTRGPQFCLRGQAPLIADTGLAGELLQARQRRSAAGLGLQAGNLQAFAAGLTQFTGAQHIATRLRDVVAAVARLHRHHGAAAQPHSCQHSRQECSGTRSGHARPHRGVVAVVPGAGASGMPARMRAEKSVALSAAIARAVKCPRCFKVAKG